MKSRTDAREAALKILYKLSILEEANLDHDIKELIHEECPIQNDFVNTLVYGIKEKEASIIKLANSYLIDWRLDRLNKVDQAIFKIGIYELKFIDTPSIVAINEALELSKKYSEEKVTKMLNGVLDSIYHSEEDANEK